MSKQTGCAQCERYRAQGATSCAVCGSQLAPDEVHWAAGQDEFARRYTVADVPGFWNKRLTIAPNQRALVFLDGSFQGEVQGGTVDMGGLKARMLSLGRAKQMLTVVMRGGAVDLDFSVMGAQTADHMTVRVVCQTRIQVSNPMLFYRQGMGEREVLLDTDVRQIVFEAMRTEVTRAIGQLSLDALANGPEALIALEASLPSVLESALQGVGLGTADVRVVEVSHGKLDELRKLWEQGRMEELADEYAIEAADRAYARDRTRAGQGLRREQAETVEDVAERNAIRREAERLIVEGKMARITTEEELAEFLAEVDKQGVLREQDVAELKRGVREANEDHDLARAHLLETLRRQRQHETNMLDAEQRRELANYELGTSIGLHREQWEYRREVAKTERSDDREESLADAQTDDEILRIGHRRDMEGLADCITLRRLKDEARAKKRQMEDDRKTAKLVGLLGVYSDYLEPRGAPAPASAQPRALSQEAVVKEALRLLRDGLAPFIGQAMEEHSERVRSGGARADRDRLPALETGDYRDVYKLLKFMLEAWSAVFHRRLDGQVKSALLNVKGMRNAWAHQEDLDLKDTYRLLDNVGSVLEAVQAPKELVGEARQLEDDVLAALRQERMDK